MEYEKEQFSVTGNIKMPKSQNKYSGNHSGMRMCNALALKASKLAPFDLRRDIKTTLLMAESRFI